MDIFTTALTKVVPVTIKPETLKVKALYKDTKAKPLSDDSNRLENHDYFYLINDNQKEKEKGKDQKSSDNHSDESFAQGIKASEDVIIHKDEIIHPKDHKKKEDDDEITHLDIFI
ncbi:hypothetical protein [Thalassotalea profundi]|uniref:Uncharacterized protein n=1 Tax=Thalassotalea profundi TaxID=2036687 RepID=A0ABQ3IBY0_9GAMM|nr:hypothetical protein [Thalassotalea profundi]GHE78510.1 hypothetical protein GCM10011501_02920 [Thalassotalea profundi]